jgi:uncharacterized protein YyaL (SSP411 family)
MIERLLKIVFLILVLTQTNACNTQKEKIKEMADSTKRYTNKLINEKSPYLLQHAHNPVDWYPWGEEAFTKAKLENKPIFLSIGYSTCHWCHVMEHESFEDEEVAALMNEVFISIKVDREERPDIDNIYMSVCQMLTGSGGWPLTIVMTPDQKPFFAGTYFPKHSKGNRFGMMELIPKIKDVWENQREEINKSADDISSKINQIITIDNQEQVSSKVLENAFNTFSNSFDPEFGGFGDRPKFPSPHNLSFLLRYHLSQKNDKSLDMVVKTLTEMRKGGIFDHVGFGFHRYSTDKKWFLPHFEKMLYDQAMLTIAYTEAYQLTKNALFRNTVDEVLTYVLRDMTSPNGGFYSAEDADSEGEEGKFYLWDKKEVQALLGKEDGELFSKTFNIIENGNYFEEASGHQTGTNHLYLVDEPKNLFGNDKSLNNKINHLREILFETREKRIHPYKDDKILTDWNGLMIAALAQASRVLENEEFLKAAENSIDFIFKKLVDKNGKLQHRFRDGEAAINAQIDDYSFLIWGLLEVYRTNFDVEYLTKAIELTEHLITKFWDNENNSGFYFTSENDSELISRPKEFYDGAIPSGNSVMFSNLIKLNKLTANQKYIDYAENLSLAFKIFVDRTPTGFSQFLSGLQFSLDQSYEIIIVGEKNSPKTEEMLDAINSQFLPNKVVMLITEENREEIKKLAPFTENYTSVDGKTTAYVCKNFVCNLPTTEIANLLISLNLQ